MVTFSGQIDIADMTSSRHSKVVTNTFRLQHLSPRKKALYNTLIELYISEIRYNIYNLIKLLDQNKPQL